MKSNKTLWSSELKILITTWTWNQNQNRNGNRQRTWYGIKVCCQPAAACKSCSECLPNAEAAAGDIVNSNWSLQLRRWHCGLRTGNWELLLTSSKWQLLQLELVKLPPQGQLLTTWGSDPALSLVQLVLSLCLTRRGGEWRGPFDFYDHC